MSGRVGLSSYYLEDKNGQDDKRPPSSKIVARGRQKQLH
jgi:hypothetical protein